MGKTSQNENESGALRDEHRNRYIPCERQTVAKYVWNSAFHVTAASTINTNKHTGDEDVAYVNSLSFKYRHIYLQAKRNG